MEHLPRELQYVSDLFSEAQSRGLMFMSLTKMRTQIMLSITKANA